MKRARTAVSNFFLVLFLIALLGVGVVAGVLTGIVVGVVVTTKPVTLNDLYSTDRQTVIYDSDGNVLTTLKSAKVENSIWAGIDEIPEHVRNAFIAIEDERFYTHNGVDIKRSASAVLGFFVGSGSHGGSTITQQLVKNMTGDDAHSVPRKIREQWRAIQLENLIKDKDRILELYLNRIYFANNCYGIQIAANKYFDCDVSDLSLAQAAFLAGIPNNPNKFNPQTTTGRQNAYKRQVIILDKMLELGYITEDEYIDAIQTKLTFKTDSASEKKDETVKIYSYFEDMVIKSVREDLVKAGYSVDEANDLIFNGGLTIYTTQDSKIQKIVDDIFTNESNFRMNVGRDPEDCSQCAIAIMDHSNGRIVAVYGGYGEKTQSLTYNRATDIQRQPGSTIKPLLIYGPLIDQKIITAGTALDELAEHLDTSNPERVWPSNWDDKVHGLLNARYALLMSFNIPAAHFFVRNMPVCLEYLKREGIDKFDEPYASTALGGFKKGVSPLEMAAGYSAIANGGIYYEPVCYTKVYNQLGELILDNTTRPGTVVYEDPDTAAVVTSMLESVAYDPRSTGRFVGITYGDTRLPLGGKTGSTTDLVDYWFAGFTAYYTAACWYGYDDSSPCDVNIEGGWATTIWHKVMEEIHRDLPIKDLRRSDNLVKVEICTSSGKRATEACKKDPRAKTWVYEEIYIKGTEPGAMDYCDCHKEVEICTESKDEYGKYCLATEWCHLVNSKTRTAYGLCRDEETVDYIMQTIEDNNDENGKGGEIYLPNDWTYEVSHEYCEVCFEKAKAMGLLPEGTDITFTEKKKTKVDETEETGDPEETENPGESGETPEEEERIYTYFEEMVLDSVRKDLIKAGYTEEEAEKMLFKDGIIIFTTMDPKIQKVVDEIYKSDTFLKMNQGKEPEEASQSAFAVIDQSTGRILAIYGGYGEKKENLAKNRALDLKRQPGSVISPLLIYGPLIDAKEITAGTVFEEDREEQENVGIFTARYSMMMNYNNTALRLFEERKAMCLSGLSRAGIDRTGDSSLKTGLGFFDEGVSPLELAAAYAAIANGGTYYEPICYTKVYSKSGKVILDNTKRYGTSIYDDSDTAAIITSMLETCITDKNSKDSSAAIAYGKTKIPVAGKSGTSEHGKDYWFAGFTGHYTAVCWYGYDDGRTCDETVEGDIARTVWQRIMEEINEDPPLKDLYRGYGVRKVSICGRSGKRAGDACMLLPGGKDLIYNELFLYGTEPDTEDICDICYEKALALGLITEE